MKLVLTGALAVAFLGGGAGVTRGAQEKAPACPVSGKAVKVEEKTPRVLVNGKPLYFCCDKCPAAFAKTPEKFVREPVNCPVLGGAAVVSSQLRAIVNNNLYYFCCPSCDAELLSGISRFIPKTVDPVTGKEFKPEANSPHVEYKGQHYFFTGEESRAAFDKNPEKYAILYGR